jgi:hypothetical protein
MRLEILSINFTNSYWYVDACKQGGLHFFDVVNYAKAIIRQ